MFGLKLTEYDHQVYREQLADFLPARLVDAHAHIWKEAFVENPQGRGCVTWVSRVACECTAEDLLRTYEQLFPGKTVTPVLMGYPLADLQKANAYARACGEKYMLPTLLCTAWDTPPEQIRQALTTGGFAGIKPYLSNAPDYIPPAELRIFDFLPHSHLRVADELGAAVLLHIPRPQRLKDPVNLAQMMEIDRLYPNAKVIVAHVGRAYTEGDLAGAFDVLRHSKNLLFDFSASTLGQAMIACIEAVGPGRVLFGSDMPITKMRMYRVAEGGTYKNVVPRGLYGDVSGDINMKESDEAGITVFLYEELLAFRRAARALRLSANEVEEILCGNALRLFNINI
ncbi:MAG: amidohydrolase [Oscillospiraceae bacterium]|jgi:predicted TIM-barrel fold metal-dependent hydrolase|nr:amidohydrolase [Oscillospiraceae bacterium]